MTSWLQALATISGVGIGAVAFWKLILERLLKNWLDSEFAIRLANHEHELDTTLETHKGQLVVEAEMVRADNQKRIQEFSLFATKKHQVYAEFYQLLRIAKDKIDILTVSEGRVPDCAKKTVNEVNTYLRERKVSEMLYDAIQVAPNVEKRQELVNEAVVSRDQHDAKTAVRKANEYYALNLIYMSPEIEKKGAAAFMEVVKYRNVAIEATQPYALQLTYTDNAMKALSDEMRKEITAGVSKTE